MPKSKSSVTLDTSVLDGILKHSKRNAGEVVAKVAFSIEGKTKINIQQMDAIDTGALLNSVYVSTSGGSGKEAMAIARSRNPQATIVPLPVPEDDQTAYVGPSVHYALEVHMGSGAMAGRPYLLQAIRDVGRDFGDEFGVVCTNGKR